MDFNRHPTRPRLLKGEIYETHMGRAVIVDVMTWPFIKVILENQKLSVITDSQILRKIR